MAGEIKNLVKHGSIYTLGMVLGQLVSFLMIPIYTNYLNPSEYGILELLSMTVDVLSTIIGIGITASIMRFYYGFDNDHDKNQVVSTALIATMTIMSFASAICILFSSSLSKLVFSSPDFSRHFRIMFVTMFLTSGIQVPMVYLRAKLKSFTFVKINLIKLLMQLTLNIYFLAVLKLGVLGILYSTLIASMLVCIYLTVSTFLQTGIGFSFAKYKKMLRFGAPLIISDFCAFILTYGDRYFLNHYTDLSTVGIYSLAYKFGMMISILFAAPFVSIWGASMFDYAKKENSAEIYASIMNYFLIGALTISLALSVYTKDMLRFMADSAYWSAYKVVPIIAASYVISGAMAITGAGILIGNKTKYRALSTLAATIVNITLNILIIPPWGAYGAAISTLLSYAVRMAVDYYYSQRLFRISYEWDKILKMIGIFIFLIIIGHLIIIDNIVLSIFVCSMILFAFPLSLYFLGIITEDNKNLAFSFIRNRLQSIKGIQRNKK